MPFFPSFINHHSKKKNPDRSFGVQQWSYYGDLVIESSQYTISSLRYSRLQRSLYNLIYIPNDEFDYFIDYMGSCSLSSYIQFILDINIFNRTIRENPNDDNQQTNALTLFHRYLSLDSNFLVPINDDIRRTTLSSICPINDSTKPDVDCFRMARDHIWQLIEQNIYSEYLQSTYHINYQLKFLTSNQIELHDIFYDSSSLSYLIEFVRKENIFDYLQFWIDVERFHQNILNRNFDKETLNENALDIYNRYISLQASVPLGFDDVIRAHIECSICQIDMDAGPSIDTFDQAVWIIYMIIEREYFSKFLQSDGFYQYMTDLMLKLRCQQPILHMMKTLSIESEDLISTNQSDKDSQCNKGSLSMGYIDSLGRFIRNPDVDSLLSSTRKTYSNPIEFLSQFIRNEQDEHTIEQEAVKFAEAFINEITNKTKNFAHE